MLRAAHGHEAIHRAAQVGHRLGELVLALLRLGVLVLEVAEEEAVVVVLLRVLGDLLARADLQAAKLGVRARDVALLAVALEVRLHVGAVEHARAPGVLVAARALDLHGGRRGVVVRIGRLKGGGLAVARAVGHEGAAGAGHEEALAALGAAALVVVLRVREKGGAREAQRVAVAADDAPVVHVPLEAHGAGGRLVPLFLVGKDGVDFGLLDGAEHRVGRDREDGRHVCISRLVRI